MGITTFLLRKNGNFICKIFRGRDINLLYTKLGIFFNNISVAKPKSSRNSSIEAFVVCNGYNPPNEHFENNKNKQFDHNKTILFVACGDLSAFDSDANYPLILNENEKKQNEYDYIQPLQPPTNPNYKSFMKLKQNQVFSDKQSVIHELDEDIIHSIDSMNDNKQQIKLKNKITPKSKDRKRGRNEIVFYSSLIGAAVVMFYLTKFYYSTHQANDSPNNSETNNP